MCRRDAEGYKGDEQARSEVEERLRESHRIHVAPEDSVHGCDEKRISGRGCFAREIRSARVRRETVALQDVDGDRPIPCLLEWVGKGDDKSNAHSQREQKEQQDFWQAFAQKSAEALAGPTFPLTGLLHKPDRSY